MDNGIIPIDEGSDAIVAPDEPACSSFLCWLQDKTHAGIVALALDAIQSSAFTAKTHPSGFVQADAIGGMIRPAGKGLCHRGINMIRDPGDAGAFGVAVQRVFRKLLLLSQTGESATAFLFVGARDGVGGLPLRIAAHLSQSFGGESSQSVIEAAPCFQVCPKMTALDRVCRQGQLDENSRCPGSFHGASYLLNICSHYSLPMVSCQSSSPNAFQASLPLKLQRRRSHSSLP